MRREYENKVINGVHVLRRADGSYRHWICKCPLCHEEFSARTDALVNETVKNCGKHSKAYHERAARKAERERIRQGLTVEPSTPEDDAEYGVVQELDSKGRPIVSPAERKAKKRAKRDAEFMQQRFPDSLLTPLQRLPDEGRNQVWVFQCACGGKTKAQRSNVVAGRKRSCGCIPRGRPKAAPLTSTNTAAPTIKSPRAFLDLLK